MGHWTVFDLGETVFESSKAFGNKGCTTSYDSLFWSTGDKNFIKLRSNTFRIRAAESVKECATFE